MKRSTVITPLLLPKISEHTAVQLTDVLQQLLAAAQHHYAPQIRRWQRQRCHPNDLRPRPQSPKPQGDSMF